MIRQPAYVVLAGLLISSGCTSRATEPATETVEPAARAATIKELMLEKVIPLSNVVFQAASVLPGSDDEWDLVRASAVELSRSAGTLLQDTASPHARDAAWIEACQILAEASRQAALAAESRDADAVIAAGDRAFGSCEQCHAKYLPTASP